MQQTRQQNILDYINSHRSADIEELAGLCQVSEATIRRDLEFLKTRGSINRVHGGAVTKNIGGDPFFLPRTPIQSEAKKKIGKAAAELVNDNETIIISTGSTTEAMIPFLAGKNGLSVITNALNIAYRLSEYNNINVIVLGGFLRHSEYDLLGYLTENALADLVATKLFRGIFGIHPQHGFTASNMLHVRTDQQMIQKANELIILADHTKFHRVGSVQFAPIAAASTIITDSETTQESIEYLHSKGIKVIIV